MACWLHTLSAPLTCCLSSEGWSYRTSFPFLDLLRTRSDQKELKGVAIAGDDVGAVAWQCCCCCKCCCRCTPSSAAGCEPHISSRLMDEPVTLARPAQELLNGSRFCHAGAPYGDYWGCFAIGLNRQVNGGTSKPRHHTLSAGKARQYSALLLYTQRARKPNARRKKTVCPFPSFPGARQATCVTWRDWATTCVTSAWRAPRAQGCGSALIHVWCA